MVNPHTLLIEPGYLNIAVEGIPVIVGLYTYLWKNLLYLYV